jgi:predicted glycosyltransferase
MIDHNKRRFRVLIYSHDTFGLGHLRRCRTIAHALVDHRTDLTVLILSGSPIIGNFSFCHRVDFVRIPGIIKLHDGDYTPLSLDIGIEETLTIRAEIIRRTAEAFRPDVFLVDKEPLGLRGEVKDTLTMLKARGTSLVLGLRDVMDEPAHLAEEWERKDAVPALTELYDNIWIYGLPQICNALEGIPLPPATLARILYTGYLRRSTTGSSSRTELPDTLAGNPFVLVTTGGGGDGAALIDWVLSAYENDPAIPWPALLVLGPFMRSAQQAGFIARAQRLAQVHAITFEANLEDLLAASAGVVAMGGYNTFCEILSFDKPALLAPRTTPRLEQYIRAKRAQDLGLVRMALAEDGRDPQRMAALLRALPLAPRPSQIRIPGLLDGLDVIADVVDGWLSVPAAPRSRLSLEAQAG